LLAAYTVGVFTLSWGWALATLVGVGFVLFLVDRRSGISIGPGSALTANAAEEARRYSGPPRELTPELRSGLQVSRRSKLQTVPALIGCFGCFVVVLALAVPPALLFIFPLLFIGYIRNELRGSRAWDRLQGHELRIVDSHLPQVTSGGELVGSIDLQHPFTYEYLLRHDCAAVYRLRQGLAVVEFTSAAKAAPWVARDLLGVEWPPIDRAVQDGC
jgi:hypothetical protein